MQKEINKYLKLVQAEKLKKNHNSCIELYNVIGGLHSEIGSYDEACHYHEEAYKLCKTIGDRPLTMVTFRYIGEAKASLGLFYEAIDYIKRYLELAEKLNDKVELQRAWTTLGRVYLMQAQDLKDKQTFIDKQTKEIAREAEKRFQTALTLAESVKSLVEEKEFAQMTSGLLINLGLVKDICGQHQEAVIKFNRAIETCRRARIKDDLYRAQIILTGVYRQRYDVKSAVRLSEDALQTARSIGKKLYICEALIERGLVRLCQRDFKNAKRTFARAYLEKSPNEDDHSKAIRLTKLSHLVVDTYERVCKGQTSADEKWRSCDKLGDLFVAIGIYKLAIEFYRRAYSDAKLAQRSKSELAKILYSIAETYADDGQYQQALLCYEKEMSYRTGQPAEQCQSLIKIAHMFEYLEKDPERVAEAYEKALDKAGKEPKLMHSVLKYHVPYMKQRSFNATRYRELNETLKNLKSYPEVAEEIEGENQEEADDMEDEVTNVDDIITDDEDNDEVLMIGGRRKVSGSHSRFKPNEVGDTPLHAASINGDLKRVRSLIAQGHEINPRDNAGWIPLHEACNHGHLQVAEILIENGADVNNRGLKGMSPLHDAATNGHYDIMRLLVKNGANVIALTDTGETVLSCLRDYKNRNAGKFANRDETEYQLMEVELLNAMDKCGFDLMAMNSSKSRRVGASSAGTGVPINQKKAPPSDTKKSGIATNRSRPSHESAERPRSVSRQIDDKKGGDESTKRRDQSARLSLDNATMDEAGGGCSNSIKEYRRTIQTLKRKRNASEEAQPEPKKSQPSTLVGAHGSMSTKQWLAPDDYEEFEDRDEEDDEEEFLKRQQRSSSSSNKINDINKGHTLKDIEGDDNDDDIVILGERTSRPARRLRSESPELWSAPLRSPTLGREEPIRTSSPMAGSLDLSGANNEDFLFDSDQDLRPRSPSPKTPSGFGCAKHFSLEAQPLSVHIDGRQLLISIKDEYTTIRELKEAIVERYAILSQSRPKVRLAPRSKPHCYVFDQDLCKDVIREREIVAEIESWNLESMLKTYCNECSKSNLNPLTSIKVELRALDEALTGEAAGMAGGGGTTKLDWAHVRLARSHIRPVLVALSRRSFQSANFQGSPQLLECPMIAQDLLMNSCILTWRNLTRLSLQCTGLLRSQFEFLCSGGGGGGSRLASAPAPAAAATTTTMTEENSNALCIEAISRRAKLPELALLDVSVNSIAYKSEQEFVEQLKRLRQVVCPKLKRFDVRRNHLQFVKKNLPASATGSDAAAAAANAEQETAPQPVIRDAELADIEILLVDQCEYALYNAPGG